MSQTGEGLERKRDGGRREIGSGGGGSPGADKFDIHFQALCSAVEQEKLEKARSILENQTHVNVNGVNGDGFTLLDLAFMTGNQAVLSLVVTHGGKEGAFFPSPEAVSAHLLSLTTESRKQVEKFNQLVKLTSSGAAPAGALSQVQLKECEKQLSLWQKRLGTMKKLKAGFDSSVCPHAPVEVVASVTGASTVNVRVREPEKFGNSLYTKFKIQWSKGDTFSEVVGEVEVKTIHTLEYNIENLAEGTRYFIRASFGNPKGYGPFSASRPKSLVPSSWRSVDKVPARISDQSIVVTNLLDQLLRSRSTDLADYSVEEDQDQEDGRIRKKGLLQLFQTAPKFAKSPKHGVYLTSIMYHEDKVLLTNEDMLPLVEVQDDVPGNSALNADFHWLTKMCFLWSDLPKLRADLSRVSTSTLRSRLLTAASIMQSALGTENLGVTYFKPLRHSSGGAVVFSLVHQVKSPKSLVSLSLKWAPLSKAQRRVGGEEEGGVVDLIRSSLRDQILFHQVSSVSVSRGLHLCYLQSHTTIDSMSVVAANTSPSILPYIKVRENPHVTSEEWQWIRHLNSLSTEAPLSPSSPTTNFLIGEGEEGVVEDMPRKQLRPTESQYAFGKTLQMAVVRLFQYLEVEEEEDRGDHRIFDSEIIELGPDISLILVLPSTDTVCSVNETSMAINLNRVDLSLVPLQAWEVLHLSTYHRKLLAQYAKLSSILDIDLSIARQTQREALSTEEAGQAGSTLVLLQGISDSLEQAWKGVRWIRDVLSMARAKSTGVGISVEMLSEWYINQPDTPDDSQFCANHYTTGSSLQVKSANVFRLDTLTNWNTRVSHSASSDSGTLGKGGLSRTPTTRSDPLQFNMMNKENESHLTNLAHVRTRLLADGTPLPLPPPPPDPPSTYSSLNYSVSTNSIDSNDNEVVGIPKQSEVICPQPSSSPEPNILQVFAAYDTGLAQGTSVRISVTTSTSAREVVDLVIKQLNMAIILKGKDGPLYENEKLRNFCLVAVIGNRERCLRDDFKPLNLQNPWKKGRLFVRMKHDLLAAIEHISRHTTML